MVLHHNKVDERICRPKKFKNFKRGKSYEMEALQSFSELTGELLVIHLTLFLLSRSFYNYWNGEHAEQGISHLNTPSNKVIDIIRYISVKLIDELIKT